MKVLLLKPSGSMCEECCCGHDPKKHVPAQLVLTAALLRRNGFDVTVNDMQVQPLTDISPFDICIFWVSVPDRLEHEMEQVIKAKRAGKTTIVIPNDALGMDYEIFQKYDAIDFLVRLHERELTIAEILKELQAGGSGFNFPGIIFRSGNGITDRGERKPEDSLSFLKQSTAVYKELPLESYTSAFLLTGKGCPHHCSFCSFQKTKPRKRDIGDVLQDVEYLSHYFKAIELLDLNIAADKEWTKEFLHRLAERRFNCQFTIDCRIEDFHDRELLRLFKRANFALLLVGIEHVSPVILKSINKYFNPAYISEGVKNCRQAGIMPSLSFIIGFPDETRNTVAELEKFIRKPPYFLYHVTPLFLNKDTLLYERFKKEGLLESERLEDIVRTESKPPYHTHGLTSAEIIFYVQKLKRLRETFSYRLQYKALRLRSLLP